LAVQGVPAETWIRDSVLPEVCAATPADRWQRAAAWMLQGDKGTTLHLLIRVPGGEPRGLSVTRSLSLNDRWPLDPPAFATESLPGGIAVVRIASLGDEEVVRQFDRAFPDFTRVQGLVLDLRRATDGKTEFAYQILARLTDRPFSAVRWKTPQYRAVFRAWNLGDSATTWYGPEAETVAPRADRPAYGGPIAALVSSATAPDSPRRIARPPSTRCPGRPAYPGLAGNRGRGRDTRYSGRSCGTCGSPRPRRPGRR